MAQRRRKTTGTALLDQLSWFIRLRWAAGAAVLAGGLFDLTTGGWYSHARWIALQGLVILLYNLALRLGLPHVAGRRRPLLMLAVAQILLDLTCLTHLAMWTGGLYSPLLGFFVFHMVFASLLMPRRLAYACGVAGILLVLGALRLTHQWPAAREPVLVLWGWMVTLLFTVFLANHITRTLRRQRRRLQRLTRQMRRQQRHMVQHEKMVALGQMAAGVAHEVSNPLASMDSLLQLMQRNPDRQRPDSIATLREQVQRIHKIVQLMRGFAHPAQAPAAPLAINEAVEQALEMVRLDTRLSTVRVDRQFAADAGAVRADMQALQQVLVNLILNALDALSQTPQPLLTLRTLRRDGWCEIEIADNGPGIPPEHRKRLFEPFFTTKPVGKGTGLGLAISHSLIEQQRGRISVKNLPGGGVSFIIHLPAEAP